MKDGYTGRDTGTDKDRDALESKDEAQVAEQTGVSGSASGYAIEPAKAPATEPAIAPATEPAIAPDLAHGLRFAPAPMPTESIVPSYAASTKKPKKQRKPMGINRQLLVGFEVFTVIIIILLWVFQILLLDTFYENIKRAEVRSTAETIEKSLKSEELEELVFNLFVETQINIFISDERGNPVMDGSGSGIANAGESIPIYGFAPNTSSMYEYTKFDLIATFEEISSLGGTDMTEQTKRIRGNVKNIRSIKYGRATSFVDDEGGTQYRLILLETEITPIDSTVDTLKVQLLCLTIVMIVLGVVLALFIAKKISEPIVSMNESAKELAQGNYKIEFEEKGSREVTELAHTLNYASSELSKVDALRSELIANVSHDLRTPLTMIKGYSEVMRDIPGENSPENLKVITDEASRLEDLVNDMLDLSKLESGNLGLDVSRFNLTQEIRSILGRYDKFADFTFIFEASEDVFVEADELKISQVIYNLVNNAVNYIGEDKTIIVRQMLHPASAAEMVRIEVIDHGAGIPANKLKDIWDRYYKVDKEHKRANVGTGLGLSIVKNILDMHGGSYGVASQEGEGSTFWFELKTSRGTGSSRA